MTGLQIGLLVLGVLCALGLSFFTYQTREPKGRGRGVLVALRTATLTLIVLLLLDPRFDASTGRPGRGGIRLVLDASLSMLLGSGDSTAWQAGRDAVARLEPKNAVLLAGSGVRAVPADSLDDIRPFAGETRILPAIQSAAEAGASTVLVITDGAVQDAAEVGRWLPALGIGLDFLRINHRTQPNRALSSVEAPSWAEAGKPLTVRIGITSTAAGPATVVLRQNGNQLARADLALIENGTVAHELTFTALGPSQGGLVRYDIGLEPRDSIPDDDLRSTYVFVSEKPAGVAIVSFAPDWEPRFLHPVIESALGLPVRTFLRLPSGIYLRAGDGLEAGTRVEEAVVTRAIAEADLLVLHGLGRGAPEWALEGARSARRLIVFPAAPGTPIPIATSAFAEADWYVAPDLPPSPISSLLAGIDANGLPPLTGLQTPEPVDDAWVPLLAGRTRRGGTAPVVLAAERAGRRWAVALGEGYWRWAFRGGAPRDAYERLWAALAGWVVQDRAQVAGAAIRPVERSVARAIPIRWVAPGITADSLVLGLRNSTGSVARAVMPLVRGDTAVSGAPAPGHYTYDITAFAGGREIARARGPLTVETYSPEFIRRPVDLSMLERAPQSLARRAGAGRPLHAVPWVYVLLVALLCAEWVLRRRWGLR